MTEKNFSNFQFISALLESNKENEIFTLSTKTH